MTKVPNTSSILKYNFKIMVCSAGVEVLEGEFGELKEIGGPPLVLSKTEVVSGTVRDLTS